MEYNYEDEKAMKEIKNSPEFKKEKNKKFIILLFCCLPIIVGVSLYVSMCSTTLNYLWIYQNKIVNSSNQSEAYYKLGDSNIYSIDLEETKGEYKLTTLGEMFKIDLDALRDDNFSYQNIMFNIQFDIKYIPSNIDENELFPVINYSFDQDKVDGFRLNSADFTSYSSYELKAKEYKMFKVSVFSNSSNFGVLLFKNVRVKIYGVGK